MKWFLLVIFYGKIEVFSSLTVENKSKLKINRNFLLVRSCIGFISGKDANFSLVVKMQTFLLVSRCKLFSCCQDANFSLVVLILWILGVLVEKLLVSTLVFVVF